MIIITAIIIIIVALWGWELQISRIKQMSAAPKDPILLHSRTNEYVKEGLASLTRKQHKQTQNK